MDSEIRVIRARWVMIESQHVVENGAVSFRDGVIVEAGHKDDVNGRVVEDFGDALICPGFVNAHTHLELTYLHNLLPPDADFVGWLRRMYQTFLASPPSESAVAESVRAGIEQSLRSGVTTVGDITRNPNAVRPVLAKSSLRAVSFGEVIAIGQRRTLLAERLAAAVSREHETERCAIGVSPHAPYSVEPEGMRACAAAAMQNPDRPLRVCVHAGETKDEDAFTRSREGAFADYLRELGPWWDANIPISECGPFELLDRCELLTPRTVIAHANYASDDDIQLLADRGASVAYCPRTHHAFGHEPHRFREMLATGVNVAIGTDSLASNPSLSIIDELRFLHQHHRDVPVETVFDMGTRRAAKALGLETAVGSIRLGMAADFAVFIAPNRGLRPLQSVLQDDQPPCGVFVCGDRVP